MAETLYTDRFFKKCAEGSLTSARKIVPYLQTLTGCRSVVDVGCGLGAWLSVFCECGITDFQGIDGAYVNQDKLLIPKDKFIAADLTKPPEMHRSYDVAICLEVAEHLPSTADEILIDFLIGLSPVIVFSASIPFQDGTAHINEQWIEHWVQRFESRGYVGVDCIRPRFWSTPDVDWWYAQNTIVYVNGAKLTTYPKINAFYNAQSRKPLSLVHPRLFLYKQNCLDEMPVIDAWKKALARTWKVVARRLINRKSTSR
jgi:hypothetical protein